MTLRDDLLAAVKKTLSSSWTTRDGQKVPEPDEVNLGNDAVKLSGTVLYADLSESTGLVTGYRDWFAAEIYKSYLYCAAKIIRSLDGSITAYDGDRVMAVFMGGQKNSNAAKCGLKINYAVKEIIQPAIMSQYPKNTFHLRQVVGIDTSNLFIAQTGIRGSNDLVWVGRAANYAAKMAGFSHSYPTYITADVYNMLVDGSKFGSGNINMWTNLGISELGVQVYGSTWQWGV
jgi:class 3 adenylate cyclase